MSDIKDFKRRNLVLKEILNSSWDGIAIINLEGEFTYTNKAFSPLFAYSTKEIQKLSFLDLLDDDSKISFKKLLKENLSKTYNNKLNLTGIRKDGKTIYISISIQLMSNKKMFILNVSDITEIVTKNNHMDKFIITLELDTNYDIITASEAFFNMTELDKENIIHKNYTCILSPMTLPLHKKSLHKNLENKTDWEGKLVIKQKDNKSFNVEAVCNVVLNKYSDVVYYSMIMVNTSNFTSSKEETLEKLLIDEEEKLAIMSDTMRTVAHEWRQPLNSISLGAQELIFELDFEDEINKENILEKLEKISENTQELSNIIESFQNITNIEGSKKKRNIKEIVSEALKIADIRGDFIHIENKETKAFRTYPKELASAFSSILINAKEILEDKPDKQINILTYDDGNNIVCEISNNGGHIPEDIIKKIFTPYFSTKEIRNGVGLSLYICKIVVELHLKGTIVVTNEDDDIVRFKLSFPKGALE